MARGGEEAAAGSLGGAEGAEGGVDGAEQEGVWQPGPGTYTQHLSGLKKLGKGASSVWLVGRYLADASPPVGEEAGGEALGFEAALQPDRNAEYNCVRMLFRTSEGKKIGYLLVENRDEQTSSFRGMWINEDLRGQGMSKLFLAVWLRICLVIGVAPRTNRIDKPLLALLLHKFGFVPASRRCEVEISPGSEENGHKTVLWSSNQKDLGGSFSNRALKDQHMVVATVRPANGTAICVNTGFETPLDLSELDVAVAAALRNGFELCAAPAALRQAFVGRLRQSKELQPDVAQKHSS